ncbi:bifunctional polysaccharide deacetylase/glycosyltransferase family 2 protein [Actinoplanes sp. Pm04-4]|uniref:Bifunctional polysaccharide deacetylase/glycosyltransferase family 2 protein n=1 Tax=Paractinoplanes pyxinae TaxID=2997416 RepID=A0ABT4AW90_9ACTN|nr:bifunctional polysaccharide deacetylase/glycosyltransferase family 2 protein [Actinoplanes pyxinae]MCY1138496.1 bifunctional polysaccharide deacetylase/glycosyltransferase family 2 protein [Actinoplanes pyxinae]
MPERRARRELPAVTVYRSSPPPHDPGEATSLLPPLQRKRRIRRRRVLAGALGLTVLLLLATVILVSVYTDAGFSPDGTSPASTANGAVPANVRDGGPVIDLTEGGGLKTYEMPARTIALTFDDGPDPQWTPKILDVLAKHHAPATFFVVGSQVARHPGLAERIAREGHELGGHTFTHPDLAELPEWRREMENSQTQLAIADATGGATRLMRPPYSSFADALTDKDWQTVQAVGAQGYLTVLDTMDSEDWKRPGADAIVRNLTPKGTAGQIVLLHDAGGDRSQTVAALDRLIPQLQKRGFRFSTVSAAIGGQVNPPATDDAVWRGRALVGTIRVADAVLAVLWVLLITAGGLIVIRTLILFAFAWRHSRHRRGPDWSWGLPVTSPVTIVVPAYNEEKTIGPAVRSLALSAHPGVEVLVVDDGSTDGTAAAVRQLKLGNVRVVSIPNGGKANALNAGVALSRNDLIVMVDADTVVEPDAIHRLVQPFADPKVGAVAGNVKVANRRGLIGKWQHIEYVIGFNLDRRLYDTFGCIPTIPGALGAFRRAALTGAGGLSTDTLAEDTDLTLAIHQDGWRVVYEETARAYTEAPATMKQLWRQRYRWSYGTMQSMWKHRGAVKARPALIFVALFSVLLPLLAPLVDLMAVYGLLFLDREITIIGWVTMLVVQVLTAVLAFRLDREPLRPLWSLPLQQIVYRQVMYLVLLHSALAAVTGRRLKWQTIHRTGDLSSAPVPGR